MLRIAASALALAGAAYAQSSCSGTSTIQNSGDATAIGACSTWTGDIVLATGTTGNIDLGGLQQIKGNFVANNVTALSGLSGGSLDTITSQLELISITVLTSLSFPKLTTVGTINFDHLPELQSLGFGTPGVSTAAQIGIADTALQSLSGIDLQEAETIQITQNRQLSSINLQIANVSGSFSVAGNGRNLTVDLPNLTSAANITMLNVSSISLPMLQFTNTTLAFQGNSIQSLILPNLTTSGDLIFTDNEDLTNITMNSLTTVNGGFNILNNPMLDTVTGFQNLATVTGAIDMAGNFTDVEFPALHLVRGDFNLQSTGNLQQNCSTFSAEAGPNSVIEGHYVCNGSLSSPGGIGTTPSAGGSGGGKKGAAANFPIRADAAFGVASLLAAMLGML